MAFPYSLHERCFSAVNLSSTSWQIFRGILPCKLSITFCRLYGLFYLIMYSLVASYDSLKFIITLASFTIACLPPPIAGAPLLFLSATFTLPSRSRFFGSCFGAFVYALVGLAPCFFSSNPSSSDPNASLPSISIPARSASVSSPMSTAFFSSTGSLTSAVYEGFANAADSTMATAICYSVSSS